MLTIDCAEFDMMDMAETSKVYYANIVLTAVSAAACLLAGRLSRPYVHGAAVYVENGILKIGSRDIMGAGGKTLPAALFL